MHITGPQLMLVLGRQQERVEVRDARSFPIGTVGPAQAARLVQGRNFAGIGNLRRIRYIRPADCGITIGILHGASRTMQRVKNDSGVIIAPDYVLEHKPLKDR